MPFVIVLALWALIRLFTLSPGTEKELATLRPLFALRVRCWLLLVKFLLGLDVLVTDGRRTPAEQNAQHRVNPKNPAYNAANPGDHILGEALDVNFFKDGRLALVKSSSAAAWRGVVELATLCGIRWMGYSKTYSEDRVHFYV